MVKLVLILLVPAFIIALLFIRIRLYFYLQLPDFKGNAQGIIHAYIALWKIKLISILKDKRKKKKKGAADSELFIRIIKKIRRILVFKASFAISLGDAAASAITSSGVGIILNAVIAAVAPKTPQENLNIRIIPVFSEDIEVRGELNICVSFSFKDIFFEYIRAIIRNKNKKKEKSAAL
ncbi:MAG: hypothetical protein E7315_04530 [Clostridiales bacterium]|nr:hypothetical protein [Clostridiales bacterium]